MREREREREREKRECKSMLCMKSDKTAWESKENIATLAI